MLERYYNLFDPAQHYSQLLFRAGDGLQSRRQLPAVIVQHAIHA